MADILENQNNYICNKAKYRLEMAEALDAFHNRMIENKESNKQEKDVLIRRCLVQRICPDCGGNIRYRISYDFRDWILCWFNNMKLQICICKDCKTKKGLLNWKEI